MNSSNSGIKILPKGGILNKRYKIISLINRGGEGEIYKATEVATGRNVAVKFVRNLSRDAIVSIENLRKEYEILRALTVSPLFLRPYDFEIMKNCAYLVMEWFDSVDGHTFIQEKAPLDYETWLWIAKSLTTALLECHARNILHRDVKPRNILIGSGGQFKLIDFGIAYKDGFGKASDEAVKKGTALYMPPEQAIEGMVSVAGEMYSLGITLYEFLTGASPFKAMGNEALMKLKLEGKIIPPSRQNPDVPAWLDSYFDNFLNPDAGQRPQGAKEVLSLLSRKGKTAEKKGTQLLRGCQKCGAMLWKEVSFCTFCGTPYKIEVDRGKYGVMIEKVEDADMFLSLIQKTTSFTPSSWRRRFYVGAYPRILLYGVSRGTASFVVDTFNTDNSSARMLKKPVWEAIKKAKFSNLQKLAVCLAVFWIFIGLFMKIMDFEGDLQNSSMNMVFVSMVCIGYLAFETLAPLLPIRVLRADIHQRKWEAIQQMRQRLRKISQDVLRPRASALVRRGIMLIDDINVMEVDRPLRMEMTGELGKIAVGAMERLLEMNNVLDAIAKLKKSGIKKKRTSLEIELERATDPNMIEKITEKLGMLAAQDNALFEMDEIVYRVDLEFSRILSELNSLHIQFEQSGIAESKKHLHRISSVVHQNDGRERISL